VGARSCLRRKAAGVHHFLVLDHPRPVPDAGGTSEDQLNHRLYFTTTKDFVNLAPTKLLYDPGFSVIDATFLATREGAPF